MNNNDKITICHYPPGNPDNPQTITIDRHAWEAHQSKHVRDGGHDTEGECPEVTTTTTTTVAPPGVDDTPLPPIPPLPPEAVSPVVVEAPIVLDTTNVPVTDASSVSFVEEEAVTETTVGTLPATGSELATVGIASVAMALGTLACVVARRRA
jgi:hypothetical protein